MNTNMMSKQEVKAILAKLATLVADLSTDEQKRAALKILSSLYEQRDIQYFKKFAGHIKSMTVNQRTLRSARESVEAALGEDKIISFHEGRGAVILRVTTPGFVSTSKHGFSVDK